MYYKRAYDRTTAFTDGKYTPKTYYRLEQEDEDEAAKHGLEKMWGKNARLKREETEMWALAEKLVEEEEAEKARLRGGPAVSALRCLGDGGSSGLESRESGASEESVKGDGDDVVSKVKRLVI